MEHPNTGKMMAKLSKLPQFNRRQIEEQQQIAMEFTSPDMLQMKFSHLLDAGNQFMADMSRGEENPLLNTLERKENHQKMKQRIVTACNFPIRLSLQKIPEERFPLAHTFTSMLRFEYGPFHAALIISDVTIEWGRAGIVRPRFEPRMEADFQALVGENGEWKSREDNFVRQMSMANKRGSSVEKLEVLYQSMSEKVQMISRLIDVIVDYNRNKEFNVFTCNCQHFARDAMAALGIKKPVRFEGLLQQRFEQLKRGKVRVPLELKTHDNLDAHVAAFKQELDRQDMEYLQCLYFSFHLPAIEESEDRENWKCDIATCMSAELDWSITELSITLKPSQLASTEQEVPAKNVVFNQTIVSEGVFGATPDSKVECSFSESANLEVIGTEVPDDLYAVKCLEMSLPKQTKLVGKFRGYREQVLCKYRQHHLYISEEEYEMIEVLTERERLFERYFNSFVERSEQCIMAISEDHNRLETHTRSWDDDVSTRIRQRFESLCKVSCQLVYRVDFKKHTLRKQVSDTPLSAFLRVNNVTLEWLTPGLVVPVRGDKESADVATVDHILLHQDLSNGTEFSRKIENWKTQIETAIANRDVNTVISLLYEVTTQIERCVHSLLEVIVRYNRYSSYQHKKCNNLHFANELLRTLGVTDQSPPNMCLKQYLLSQPLFVTLEDKDVTNHTALDEYVIENHTSKILVKEREFLISKYFVFHIENWKTIGNGKKDWTCPLETCQLLYLLNTQHII